MRWIRPVILNGGIEIKRHLRHLRRAQVRTGIKRRLGDREQDRREIDLGEVGLHRDVVGAVLVDRRIRHDEERLVGHVEDVGDPALTGPDRPPDDECVCVQRERNLRGLAPNYHRVKHRPSIRRARRGQAPGRTTSWRRPSPGARRRAGGPRRGPARSRACRSRRPACPGGATRSGETGARSPTGGGSSGR